MKSLFITLSILIISGIIYGQKYTPIDAGSKVHFIIKNFGLKVGGNFTGLKGNIVFDPSALNTSNFSVFVNAKTIDTDNSARDKHLKKDEYFAVEKYPFLSFTSTKIIKGNLPGQFYIFGNLTIKAVTKAIEFSFNAAPTLTGYIFNGEFEINRRDYGVGGSSFSLSDNLKVTLSIVANK